jgi:hypothetical protein
MVEAVRRQRTDMGSIPVGRTNSEFAWEANLVKAPRRSRGEVGSKPTPGTIYSRGSDPSRHRSVHAELKGLAP